MLTAALLALALQPDSATLNLGTIRAEDGVARATFVLTNTGSEDVSIARAATSCACTRAYFAKHPIAPGDTAHITVTYNPNNRLGSIDEQIIVYCPEPVRLALTGKVTSDDPFNHLTQPLGRNMKVSRRDITITDIQDGQTRHEAIACANIGRSLITLTAPMVPDFVSIQTSPAPLPPNTEGDIIFVIDGSRTPNGETKIPVLLKGLDGKPSDSIITLTIKKQ